jgi:N-acyl-phosphatidylethanolamine-hydrolysing phospholipase D
MVDIRSLSLREIAEKRVHHRADRFVNPFAKRRYGSPWRLLFWKLFSKNKFKGFYGEEPVTSVQIDWRPVKGHKGCSVTFLRHASILIKDVDEYLLVDPIFGNLFWFKNYTPFAFPLEETPRPDHVLITHGHFDHLDVSTLSSLGRDPHFITPLGYDGIFEYLRVFSRTTLDWFGRFSAGGREITLLPCHHWTMRNPLKGPNHSLWGSFFIKGKSGVRIFVSGDLAYFDRFEELGKEFHVDLAIFNLGAYEPRWFMAGSHMNPAEVVQAFLEMKAKNLLIVHWGTFRLGDEPVHFPPRDIRREMERRGVSNRLIHLDHGQTLLYDSPTSVQII